VLRALKVEIFKFWAEACLLKDEDLQKEKALSKFHKYISSPASGCRNTLPIRRHRHSAQPRPQVKSSQRPRKTTPSNICGCNSEVAGVGHAWDGILAARFASVRLWLRRHKLFFLAICSGLSAWIQKRISTSNELHVLQSVFDR